MKRTELEKPPADKNPPDSNIVINAKSFNNKNNRISMAPYGRNFWGAGGKSDQSSVWLNKKLLRLDLKTDRESLTRTVCGSEFHIDGAEERKTRLEKSVK